MTDAHDIAREAAKRLAPSYGASLPMEVEKAIHGAGKAEQFPSLGDIAGVASAIIATAALAFQISHDWRQDKSPTRETLGRELRSRL